MEETEKELESLEKGPECLSRIAELLRQRCCSYLLVVEEMHRCSYNSL